ncbi:hypothetical protein ACH4SK_20195 [Streptomyces inhibens]|uniref:hypothetical protein n=1 Tax=Streptomyces inhibens TaxID=2293571 RepID=UPI00378C2C9A
MSQAATIPTAPQAPAPAGALFGTGTGIFLAWAGGSLTASSLPMHETALPWATLGTFLALALLMWRAGSRLAGPQSHTAEHAAVDSGALRGPA